ncbi:DNA cytosine methyltransferase [Citrobacter freundii]|uniref:DNA cytosine methyltransferase n=1 Tax=Citrobacter freundii TaxID=546 RepID=UPI0015E9FBE0|nr:DNA cytosine methyltransferase [Citrobacter freundii]QMD26094.1 DNA cytosine methyltransferase [Citrobacter freundii]WFW14538.1 DNA cytosine methyltransferase [Citrobacter freundii]
MNELALFAGAGGGILGGYLLGWRTVCAVERDAYAAQVLAQRQNDGILRPFPIWSDVCSFDGKPWRGIVDVVSGGFPCQDISANGHGAGIDGRRSGLWSEMARIVSEVRPAFVCVENSPRLRGKGLAVVIGDLAEMGYGCKWFRLSASNCGAPHERDRMWIVAYSEGNDPRRLPKRASAQNSGLAECDKDAPITKWVTATPRWTTEPGMGRVVHGLAHRVDRIKALGNGQVPRVAAAAFSVLRRNK